MTQYLYEWPGSTPPRHNFAVELRAVAGASPRIFEWGGRTNQQCAHCSTYPPNWMSSDSALDNHMAATPFVLSVLVLEVINAYLELSSEKVMNATSPTYLYFYFLYFFHVSLFSTDVLIYH